MGTPNMNKYNTIPETSYDNIKDQLIDGDVILVRKGHKWTSTFIKWFTDSEHYHAAIIFKMFSCGGVMRWMVVEQSEGGQRIVPLSTYDDYDVLRFDVDFANDGQYLIDDSGKIDYSYGDLVAIESRERLGIRMPDFNGEVCSGMVCNFVRRFGYNIDKQSSPKTIFTIYTDKVVFKVRPDATRHLKQKILLM